MTMRAWQFKHGDRIASLKIVQRPSRDPGPGEVRVAVRAVSLNYRDLMAVNGLYPVRVEHPVIAASDSAGEVVAVGAGVTAFKPGDRVANTFFQDYVDGRQTPTKSLHSFGGGIDGVLAEELVLPERCFAKLPQDMDYVEGSTLTCAGVTAWNAMFAIANLQPGARVLLLGTGGVSIWGLQIAKAAGIEALITSSSDEKLAKAKTLGATHTINYRSTPEWQHEVLRLTGGEGVDLVLEVGGEGTLSRSVASARFGGVVALIGGVSGFGTDPNFSPMSLIIGAKRMEGVYVGSAEMLEKLSRFVGLTGIRPVVDKVFAFDEAPDAYRHLESGRHFGKVSIRVGA
ncbi:NADPH:quinone reductase-like Zn-dependent oxidoreductase [Panacagrimonas perspica]|uniref:NADPH:quinone reductase-like Zn-dependent oxidoreductase n=2 Tax=Panacagrimonas perspica TaxID=381431 RepID=A0A4R7P4T2_9GAMM|nr:NADPH:quinone reductase-like Zn-dependent oxidoreductase [Panacagrimonas perspica]